MTVMRLRIGRKKNEGSLRPLTEKEIQKKLYGAFQEENEGSLKDEIESILAEPPRRKEKKVVFGPPKKISFSFPSFPWKKVFSILWKGLGALLKFSRSLLAKTATGWGLGLLIVALLFLAIHVLNVYRAKAMKAPRPAAVRSEPLPRRRPSHPVVERREVPSEASEEAPVKKETPIVAEPAPPPPVRPAPPSSDKPYVIQVCTYASQMDAERLTEKMKAAGLPAFSKSMGRANGKIFYPVFLGRFETFPEAQARLKEFRQKQVSKDFQDSFIRTL